MDYQQKRTARIIKGSIQDLKTVQNKLDAINKETCTDKMLHVIDEACDSIDMALKFLKLIDTDYFTSNYNGQDITLGVK
jgi:hypothetical protein